MKRELDPSLILVTKTWLRLNNGVERFKHYKETYGTVSPIITGQMFPWVVHFREGMTVRNFMRETGLCDDWDSHDFDNNWVELVEECIKE